MAKAKTVKTPSITLDELQEGVPVPLPLRIGDTVVGYVTARRFSSGSYGIGFNGKVFLPLANGKVAELQVGLNATILHSKPEDAKKAA